MDSVLARLRVLRAWFVVGFVVEAILGTVVAFRVTESLGEAGFYGSASHGMGGSVVASSALMTLVLLLLALWIFHEVIRLKNWARLVLIVVAWLGVLSAAISLLNLITLPTAAAMLRQWVPGLDLEGLAPLSAVTNGLGLALWGYVLWILQFEQSVRGAFRGRPAAA